MDSETPKKTIVRFAPSPTGFLHIGTYRTLVFNYLFVRQKKGTLILRIEDTDTERSKKEYEENILESMEWLGLEYDKIYRQSERSDIYKKYLKELIDSGRAYISSEREGERAEVIRFKNPGRKIKFQDLIRGEIEFDTAELGDFVIAKSLEEPLYHLAVVVDDFEMGITDIIRGEDHISNTPRQLLLGEAIGASVPRYAHLPIVLGSDGAKLSKRHGAKAVTEYRKEGFLPEALLNYIALLGWNPGTEQEIFSHDELVSLFDLSAVQKGTARYDEEKLRWVNKEHLRARKDFQTLVAERLSEAVGSEWGSARESKRSSISFLVAERISTLGDIDELVRVGETSFFFEKPDYPAPALIWKDTTQAVIKENLENTYALLGKIKETEFSQKSVKEAVWDFADKRGRGAVLWPLRYALSGREKSPDPFILAEILGKAETLERLKQALQKMS